MNANEAPSKKQKNKWLKVRVKPDELKAWKAKALDSGLKVSALARQLLNGVQVKPRKPPVEDAELRRALSRIGVNLNQLAAWANSRKDGVQALTLIAHLVDLERQVAALVATRKEQA